VGALDEGPTGGASGHRPIGLAPGAPEVAAGQDAAKYGTANPVVRRLLDAWMRRLRAVAGTVPDTVVDVGIGEGLCLEQLLAGAGGGGVAPRVLGVEYRLDKARVAGRLAGVTPSRGPISAWSARPPPGASRACRERIGKHTHPCDCLLVQQP